MKPKVKDYRIEYRHPHGTVREVRMENGEIWLVHGECNRCGECCVGCVHAGFENINNERLATCAIIWQKPNMCILYPRDPYEKLPDKCGYWWEKVDG